MLAPIAGEVVEQDVSVGQLLQPGTTQCFMISDTSTVWVLVNVYQKDLPYVRIGRSQSRFRPTLIPTLFTDASLTLPRLSILTRVPCRRASKPAIRAKAEERHVRDSPSSTPERSKMRLPCPMPQFCATARTSLLFTPRISRISSAGARSLSAKAERANPNYERPENRRPVIGRRQPVPAVREFAAALSRTEKC